MGGGGGGGANDGWVDVMIHRFTVQYCAAPSDEECIEWLRGCLKGSLHCLQQVLNHYSSTGHEVDRVLYPCEEAINVMKRAMEDRSEEVYLRAGELAGIVNRLRHVKSDNATLKQRLQEHHHLEERSRLIDDQLATQQRGHTEALQAKAARIGALETTVNVERARLAGLEARLAEAQLLVKTAERRADEATAEREAAAAAAAAERVPRPPAKCLACEEYSDQCEDYRDEIAELRNILDDERAGHVEVVERMKQEMEALRARFGVVDTLVEDLKASLPRRYIPSVFHRCSMDDHRWLFGSRRVAIHPAGGVGAREAVVLVGGGYLPLKEYVLKMGEAEVQKEAREKKDRAPRVRRAASLKVFP